MRKMRKIILSLVFEAALLGAAALLLIQSYGNLRSIPEEDLVSYCFWLMLAFTGMIIVGNINLFYITEAPKKRAQEPPPVIHKKQKTRARSGSHVKSKKPMIGEAPPKQKEESPKVWREEEFE